MFMEIEQVAFVALVQFRCKKKKRLSYLKNLKELYTQEENNIEINY